MLYLVALIFPPLAVLLCGKPFQAILNCLLCLLLIVPGIIHAICIVAEHNAHLRQVAIMEHNAAMWNRRGR